MPWGFVAGAAVSLIGGAMSADASRSAAHTQADAANRATDTQLDMFNTVNDQQKPYREAGYTALGQIGAGTAPGGAFSTAPTREQIMAGLAPNFDFARETGSGAVTNMANSMGGLGGNSLAEISRWNTGFAGDQYQRAFENYNTNQTNIFNRLASIAGLGQTAGSNSTTGASTFAGNIAGSQMGAGNALAAGQVGSANAISGGLNNAMGWYQLGNLMNNNASVSVPGQMTPLTQPSYTPVYQGLD
jgi:hypothetical protein